MGANQIALVVVGSLFACGLLFFLLVVATNRNWPLHVLNFLTGVVTIALVLVALGLLGFLGYLAVSYMVAYDGAGIYGLAAILLATAVLVGAPLAATYLGDVLERNGYSVGRRTYLILLITGLPIVPAAAFFGFFTALGERVLRFFSFHRSPGITPTESL